ncbi:MAG: RNA polymerase sigma factor [Chloroflexota bacterium]
MDRDLVVRARGGDRDAFARLAAAAISRLDAAARLITRDPERAKDAVQEALARAWRDLPGLRDPDRFDAWLRRLLVRACIDELRRARRHAIEIELTELHHPAVADSAVALADRDALERGFRRLDPEQRSLIVLYYYLGLSLAEAADALNVPAGTAKSRISRARDALRAALDADSRASRELLEGRPA